MSRLERFKRNDIAWDLLDGPRALIPLTKIDNFGWLEPVLVIKSYSVAVDRPSSSCSIFVDNTVNRSKNFLTPIARYAIWDRAKELEDLNVAELKNKWPIVKIFQHELSVPEQQGLDQLLRELDSRINGIEFLVGGLNADRSEAEGASENVGFRDLGFTRFNGNQSIEFDFGDGNDKNIELEQVIRKIEEFVIEVCKKPMATYYRERYDFDLNEYYRLVRYWDYRPKSGS